LSPVQPTDRPTAPPTDTPVVPPTEIPTLSPVDPPTDAPTLSPVVEPTAAPVTAAPISEAPVTATPVTEVPVAAPTAAPAVNVAPTMVPVTATAAPSRTVNETTMAPSPIINSTTMAPSDATMDPSPVPPFTFSPSPEPLPIVQGTVTIRILPVPGGPTLPTPADEGFASACEEFYQGQIDMVENLICFVLSYSFSPFAPAERRRLSLRSLQGTSALDITALIRGNPTQNETAPTDPAFLETIIDIMNANSSDFIDLLKAAGDSESKQFYSNVESAEAFDPSGSIPNASPVAPPVAPPTTNGDDDDGLSGGAIGGIVVGSLAAATAVVGGVYYMSNKSGTVSAPSQLKVGNPTGDFDPPSTAYKSASVIDVENSTKVVSSTKVASSHKKPGKSSSGGSVASSRSSSQVSKDTSSAISRASSSKDPSGIKDTEVGSSIGLPSVSPPDIEESSGMIGSTGTDKSGGDDMSYTYSLEAGTVDLQSTQAGITASSAGGSVGNKSESGSELSSRAMSTLPQNMVSRTVMVPPGKLGVVIDTTLEGPVVHKINPQSPVEGKLFLGDIIVAVDDVDTRAMSATAITQLMVRTANLQRKFTVLSEDNPS